jgi:hypothetical protein
MKVLLLVVLLAALLFASLYAVFTASRPVRLLAIGQRVQHDDFFLSVSALRRVKRIDDTTARGTFYVVRINVENRAKRVPYSWHNTIAYVVDTAGRRYAPDAAGQRAFDRAARRQPESEIPAGQSRLYDVVFDLPREAEKPVLQFWDGVLMGDAFDGVAYAKAKIRLY